MNNISTEKKKERKKKKRQTKWRRYLIESPTQALSLDLLWKRFENDFYQWFIKFFFSIIIGFLDRFNRFTIF